MRFGTCSYQLTWNVPVPIRVAIAIAPAVPIREYVQSMAAATLCMGILGADWPRFRIIACDGWILGKSAVPERFPWETERLLGPLRGPVVTDFEVRSP